MIRYRQDELLSALQKDIRRCKKDSLYWAKELSLINPELLWKKLEIIGSEDIGIADPCVQTYIWDQKHKYQNNKYQNNKYQNNKDQNNKYQNNKDQNNKYQNNKDQNNKDQNNKDIWEKRMIILNTVNYLVYQNKSRICDNVNHAYFKQPHIYKGNIYQVLKEFKKSIDNKNSDLAFKYASHLYLAEKEKLIIDKLAEPEDSHSYVLINLFWKYNKINRNRTCVLFLAHLILYRTFDLATIQKPIVNDLSMDDVMKIYSNNEILEFEDYVFDKHTDRGKYLNRGFKHFYEEAAKLVNCYIDDPYEELAKKYNCDRTT